MLTAPEACTVHYCIISPSEIHFLHFTVEAYEGVAVVTTLDPHLGLIRLSVAPGCEEEMRRILEAEGERIQLRPVSFDAVPGGSPRRTS